MEHPLINEDSFSTNNPSLAEIWPLNGGNSDFFGLRMGSGGFGSSSFIDNLLNNNGGGSCTFGQINGSPKNRNGSQNNRNGSIEESNVSEESGSDCVSRNRKKKRENFLEEESSKVVSTTTSGKDLKYPNGKCVKTSSSVEENGNSKVRREPVSTKPGEKPAEPQKDYIHVRARRGQATDSHSLAERARREKISERMKFLQDLVPGCNKVIGKAIVLDEIINYIQSLQRQVEFLSMKLEAVNSGIIPSITGFHSEDGREVGPPSYDPSGMMLRAQLAATAGGPQSEWLHMQLAGSFDRS